jgi:predicted P-loop ATPase
VGDKDAFLAIRGCWLYEISELESFTRAEATAVKAFISSQEDNFRAPYERSNTKHPRETMFAGTTNAIEYLKDWSGNTRFWPLEVNGVMLEELSAARDQLLAEAVALYRQGERTYPTLEQERSLFKPEQDRRMIAHPWVDAITAYLEKNTFSSVSVAELIDECLGIRLDKVNPQGTEAQRVGQILKALGWNKQRITEGTLRGWRWVRPPEPSVETATREPVSAGGHPGDEDDVPF